MPQTIVGGIFVRQPSVCFNKKIKEMHHKSFCSFFGTSGGIS